MILHTFIQLHTNNFNPITQIQKPSLRFLAKSSVLLEITAKTYKKFKTLSHQGSNNILPAYHYDLKEIFLLILCTQHKLHVWLLMKTEYNTWISQRRNAE